MSTVIGMHYHSMALLRNFGQVLRVHVDIHNLVNFLEHVYAKLVIN